MTDKNIVLIGFMGSGKTLISKELEIILKRKRVSIDDLIQEREGLAITDIFAQKGESYFRQAESLVVQEISKQSGLIIDCGGGVVLNPENIRLLRENGIVINLSISVDAVLKNIKGCTNRPLLNVDDPRAKIAELLDQRRPLYAAAEFSLEVDNKTIPQLTKDVLKVLENV